mgnify:CR=1 FL=1
MAVELEGLEFQIEAVTNPDTYKAIYELSGGLRRLKDAVKGGLNATSTINQLQKLSETLNGMQTGKLLNLANALQGFKDLGALKIPSSFITQVERVNEVTKNLENVGQLVALSNALKTYEGINDIKIPANFSDRDRKSVV